jgi:succinyl-CoA synthetase beta subunit
MEMKLHEYQAKELFRRYALPVPAGEAAATVGEALAAAEKLGRWPLAVKAQILAGGRGKGGGIRTVANAAELAAAATALLGASLVTAQTGPAGQVVRRLLLEERVAVAREFYLGLLPDRSSGAFLLLASAAGGMEIEAAAQDGPGQIIRVAVDPLLGLQPFLCRRLAVGLGLPAELHQPLAGLLHGLFRLFLENDCALVEINPLALTDAGQFIALDAKIELDDAGLPRHPELASWRDEDALDPLELAAARAGLNYIKLSGNIGNLVNGAGLAMATMDLIKQAGGEPANFLDVGGGASVAMVEEGMRIILADPQVKGVLINVFGGILRCDLLAEGLIRAARQHQLAVPLVVRLEGTNAEAGRRLLAESGLEMIPAADLAEATARIAAIVGGGAA